MLADEDRLLRAMPGPRSGCGEPGSCPSGTETTTVISVAVIDFEERELAAQVPDLAAGGAWTRVSLRWRRDPLTGASARILTGVKLQPDTRPDMAALTAKPAFCPFDAEYLEKATVPFPAELTAEGRIRYGHAVVVPNIMAYATHSAVGIYDPGRHFLDLY